VFLSDSGSTAVEVALKMAIGYWSHRGEKRPKILALEHGYHGDTFGAMAAGGRSIFNAVYEDYLFDVVRLSFPPSIKELEILLQNGDVAAFVFEPLVLGAGGMLTYDADCLQQMIALCKKNKVLTIADEVMTGFGRTGTMFACQQAGCWPDLLCLSKGITGGFLPLGATLATQDIYDSFYDDRRARMFFHSSSFTGNPLSCAAANAALAIWREEPVMQKIGAITDTHRGIIDHFRSFPMVSDVRQCATMLAIDIDQHGDYLSETGQKLYRFFLDHGILLRPLGNVVYILPPYCITKEELERIYDVITLALHSLGNDASQRTFCRTRT
jgi:adenosylmethionine-8-amino-7-oxononanoate aminotransferase